MSTLLLVIILGIVEGVTEYLPVSSTGHLILATELLGFDADEWALFNIAIQPGAILAVVVLYWRIFWQAFTGMFRWDPQAVAFTRNLLVAFFPAVILGLAFGDQIEMMLESAVIVSWRNQPERRSTANWAPPASAAPNEPYAAIDTIDIAAQS